MALPLTAGVRCTSQPEPVLYFINQNTNSAAGKPFRTNKTVSGLTDLRQCIARFNPQLPVQLISFAAVIVSLPPSGT